eukprot:Gb_13474 [translate_table: standard]
MPSMDIDAKKKKKEEVKEHNQELNPSPIDEVRKKRKRKDSHGMEAVSNGLNDSSTAFPTTDGDPNQSKKKKKRKKKDSLSLEKPNEHSTGGVQLEHLVARFLSSRGLSNTLSAFLSETQHKSCQSYSKPQHWSKNQLLLTISPGAKIINGVLGMDSLAGFMLRSLSDCMSNMHYETLKSYVLAKEEN